MDRMYKLGQAYRKVDDFLQKGLLSKVKDRFGKKKTSTSKALTVFDPKKALPSKLPKAATKLSKLGKVARFARAATPVALGLEAANVAYKVATMSPEKKAKVKKLKTQLSKKSTKDYHADLLKMSTGGDTMLKKVPEDKKKSLGKLPEKVRNKMGYAKKGSMMKARYGTMAKGDVKEGLKKSSEFKTKLEDFKKSAIKKLRGAQVGPAEEAKMSKMMPSMKDSPSTRESKMKAVKMKLSKLKTGGEIMKAKKGKDVKLMENISKESLFGKGLLQNSKVSKNKKTGKISVITKNVGGEMKKPMKAALGAIALGVLGAKAAKKLMKKKASAVSPAMDYLGDTAKKSKGGEMKGYGEARTSGMGLQDENLIPGKSMDYIKDLI